MSSFQILSDVSKSLMRYAEVAVKTNVADDVAHAAITTQKGMTNPLYVLSTGALNKGVFRPSVYERAAQSAMHGTGASGFDDAVKALGNLGEKHGVSGINLSSDPAIAGTLKRVGSGLFTNQGFSPEVARSFDDAARHVMDFVGAAK